MTTPTSPALQVSAFKCLRCSAPLQLQPHQITCPACQGIWAVRNGIPRFFEPPVYWGEIAESEAVALVHDAVQKGWRQAVASRFSSHRDMLISILDWQRASWLPLLSLGKDSVALDVGSGYGAITHSLAHAARTVYSLEAMPERIEFTRTRLDQEGINNVQLVQGSALELPFFDNTFDLIVTNGVLEWVGEWRTDKGPRSVQREFLDSLYKLLKPNGVLLIGIENRISYGMIRGGIDHSGVAYTSLMPRRFASFYLRHSRRKHHRTLLNPQREYRTYTYSEFGFRKLLAESGFSSFFLSPYPGYNQPYSLVPLDKDLLRTQFSNNMDEHTARRPFWRRWLTRAPLSLGIMRFFVLDFLIIARKNASHSHPIGNELLRDLASADLSGSVVDNARVCLSTFPFGKKTVLRIFGHDDELPQWIVKTSTPAPGSKLEIGREFENLSLIYSWVQKLEQKALFSVSRPVGTRDKGSDSYVVETAAPGEPLIRLLFSRPQKRWLGFLSEQFPKCADIAVQLALILKGNDQVKGVDPGWRQVPAELQSDPDITRLGDGQFGLASRAGQDWIQHGDFTAENIFLDSGNAKLFVIDWEHMSRGLPPLYDTLSLLCSILSAVRVETGSFKGTPDPAEMPFLAAFFGTGEWANLFRDLMLRVCKGIGIHEDSVWDNFVEFLVLRTHYFAWRQSGFARVYGRYLKLAAQNRDRFILWTS